MHHTLIQRVIFVTSIFLLVIVTSATFAINAIHKNASASDHLTKYTFKLIEKRNQFNSSLLQAIAKVEAYGRAQTSKDRDEALEHLASSEAQLKQLVALEATRNGFDSQFDTEHQALQNRHEALFTRGQQVVYESLRVAATNDAAAKQHAFAALAQFNDEFAQLRHDGDQLVRREMTTSTAMIQQYNQNALWQTPVVFVLLALIEVVNVIGLWRFIVKPIKTLSEAASAVAHGRLDYTIKVTTKDEMGRLQHAFNQMVANLRTQRDELMRLAFHDQLSALPNRTLFLSRLRDALVLAQCRRSTVAVMFLDLDSFKVINDSLGHQAGDQLLVVAADRLRGCIRPDDTIARLGGDEFTVLLSDVADVREVVAVAERIQHQLHVPIMLNGHEVFTTASIGIALSTPHCTDAHELLRDADTAMYRAKRKGKAQYQVFDVSMNARALERLELEADLRRALEQHEFVLHYQPIVAVATGRIVGVEALVRWQHPARGLVAPGVFIPVAEETGLIVPLGQWVLDTACRQLQHWQRTLPGLAPRFVSVNISARQFQDPHLVALVAHTLQDSTLHPVCLELEITESIIMENGPTTLGVLQELKQLGVQLAVDDFGTGYSSLAYLKRFPIDTLKIDRSFVDGLGGEAGDTAIVHAIIMLAHTLGLHVTAEGVESARQVAHLHALRCDQAQGFHFSKPVPSDAISALLATQAGRSEPAAPRLETTAHAS